MGTIITLVLLIVFILALLGHLMNLKDSGGIFKKTRLKHQLAAEAEKAAALKAEREARFKQRLSKWEADIDELSQDIAWAEQPTTNAVSDLILKPGECQVLSLERVNLLETRSVGGYPEMTVVDSGTLQVTTQRIVFQGEAKTSESLFAKLVGIQYLKNEIVISVSNRQKATTIQMTPEALPIVKRRIELALASYNGRLQEHLADLKAEKEQLENNRPKPVKAS